MSQTEWSRYGWSISCHAIPENSPLGWPHMAEEAEEQEAASGEA